MTSILSSPRFRLAVEGMLALVLLALAVRLILTLAASPEFHTEGFDPARRVDTAVLGRFDPFFRDGSVAANALSDDLGQWILYAVRAGGGGFDTAILSGPDGRQAVYRLGEALAPGVILAGVGRDHVRVSRGGAMFTIGFADMDAPTPASTAAPVAEAPSTPISASRFAAEAALAPREQGGRVHGYVLQPRGAGETLAAAGLQPGDVILSVNRAPMNAERAADLELELTAGGTAEIQYERAGQRRAALLRIEADQPR